MAKGPIQPDAGLDIAEGLRIAVSEAATIQSAPQNPDLIPSSALRRDKELMPFSNSGCPPDSIGASQFGSIRRGRVPRSPRRFDGPSFR